MNTYNCVECGKPFKLSPWQMHSLKNLHNTRLFCSDVCRFRSCENKVKSQCTNCQKEFLTLPSKLKRNKLGVFCTKECYDYYRKYKWRKIQMTCPVCKNSFTIKNNTYTYYKKQNRSQDKIFYCSRKCAGESQKNESSKQYNISCDYCGATCTRTGLQMRISSLHFCNGSCRASYFAKHNKLGGQRSLLEEKIDQHIKAKFPNLQYKVNDRDELNGFELDFYIPALRLGIEINGPAHYKPIYGDESLLKVQKHDLIKQKMCDTKQIRLITITDLLNYNKDNSSIIFEKYIDPIIEQLLKQN